MATNGAHTHIGAIHLFTAFLGVLLVGTLWRISAAHLTAMDGTPKKVGQAMAFQYFRSPGKASGTHYYGMRRASPRGMNLL